MRLGQARWRSSRLFLRRSGLASYVALKIVDNQGDD
jgi:hypothetical protein